MAKPKGLSLSAEVIVSSVIAIIIVIVVSVFFMRNAQSVGNISHTQAFEEGCKKLPLEPYLCDPETVDNVKVSLYGSLYDVCMALGYKTKLDCARACMCPL